MRGPKPAYPIALTVEEARQLQQLVRAHRTPQSQDPILTLLPVLQQKADKIARRRYNG